MRAIAQKKAPANLNAGFFQVFKFRDERRGIHYRPGPNHSFFIRTQNTAGNQLKNVLMTVKNNGMAGVMSPGVSRGVVERGGQIIYNLSFPFVPRLPPETAAA